MKYGIIVFNETINIGDDIQSYAALKRMPKVDYYIEREKMNEFISNNGENVKVLFSGWFLHNRYRFPPSPYIDPLFISCHFSSLDDSLGVSKEYISSYVIEYLKRYEPIGCRDTSTKKLLSEKRIDNYLSYCLTLTIPKFEGIKKENKVILVDVPNEVKEKVKKEYSGNIEEITHTLDKKINSKLSYEKRMENVERLLKKYQSAEFVITTRLHCALPCLALETPVLFIYDDKNIDIINRISDYIKFFDYCSLEEFLDEDLKSLFVKESRKDHIKIREDLIKRIEKFINSDNKNSEKDYKLEMVKNLQHINELAVIYEKNHREYIEKFYSLEHDFINVKYAKEYWEKEFNILLSKYENLEKKINFNSRSFSKIREKISRRKK